MVRNKHRHTLCVWNYMEEGDTEGARRGGEMQTVVTNLRMSRKHPNKLSSYSQIVQVQLSSMCPVLYQALCCLLFLHIQSLKNKQIQYILRISRCLIFPNDKRNMSIILGKNTIKMHMKVIKHWYGLEEDNMYLFFWFVAYLPLPGRQRNRTFKVSSYNSKILQPKVMAFTPDFLGDSQTPIFLTFHPVRAQNVMARNDIWSEFTLLGRNLRTRELLSLAWRLYILSLESLAMCAFPFVITQKYSFRIQGLVRVCISGREPRLIQEHGSAGFLSKVRRKAPHLGALEVF